MARHENKWLRSNMTQGPFNIIASLYCHSQDYQAKIKYIQVHKLTKFKYYQFKVLATLKYI